MSWAWIIAGAVVLVAFLAVSRLIRRLLFAFAAASSVLLLLHMQTNPAEAGAAMAAMGSGVALAGPFRRLIFRTML